MRVSGVQKNKYMAFKDNDDEAITTENAKYAKNTFTPSIKGSDSHSEMFKNINEWKEFCHKQILNGNIDFMA